MSLYQYTLFKKDITETCSWTPSKRLGSRLSKLQTNNVIEILKTDNSNHIQYCTYGQRSKIRNNCKSPYQHLQHFLCFRVHLNNVMLEGRHLRNVVVTTFPLLFLQFYGDTTYLAMTQALHEMCDKANYKAQTKQINYYELMALKKESETAVLTYVECLREQATGH